MQDYVLIGWNAIDTYIEKRWSIPKSTCLNYHKEMRDCGAVLKRKRGKPPNRRNIAFAVTDRIDHFIELKFKCPPNPAYLNT